MAYVRTVKTSRGETAVQIVWTSRRGSRRIENLGSARTEAQLQMLKAAAAQRLAGGRGWPASGLEQAGVAGGPLEVVASCSQHLWDALCVAYRALGFDTAFDGDHVFRDLVLARIIEPTSKVDALRVLMETGVNSPAYGTRKRRLLDYAKPETRQALAAACATHAHLKPISPVLCGLSTLHFETDAGDGSRQPKPPKERRWEPQITLGLFTDTTGFPLNVAAFSGIKAQIATVLPAINAFKSVHPLLGVTVVADAGMISDRNRDAIQAAGLSFILGTKVLHLPNVVSQWCDEHPGEAIPDGLVLTQPWPSTGSEKSRGIQERVIHYQYRHDRARRTLRAIDEQVRKAECAVDSQAPAARNRYIQLSGDTQSVNRTLEAQTRALAGWKSYATSLVGQPPSFVIDCFHRLRRAERAFRMSKDDLEARPIHHRIPDSIEAHLSVVLAAMAVSQLIERRSGWKIEKFVNNVRRYRTVQIRAGRQILTAADPVPNSVARILAKINNGDEH